MSDPSLLVTQPTATDPSLAPDGHELVSVLAPAPNTDTAPRSTGSASARATATSCAACSAGRGIELGEPVESSTSSPPPTGAAQGLAAGTPFSRGAHVRARPARSVRATSCAARATSCSPGSGTTPGVGVPTVLVSGKLAAARITG